MEIGNILYYGGIALASCGGVLGVIAFIVLHAKAKRLDAELDREYGTQKK